MESVNETSPKPKENEEMTEETNNQTVRMDEMEWVLHEMKKNKSSKQQQ